MRRIGIDVKTIAVHRSGISRFLCALIPGLVRCAGAEVEYCAFGPSDALAALPDGIGRVRVTPQRALGRLRLPVYDQVQLAQAAARHSVDLLYSPYFDAPIFTRARTVVTVYDAWILRGAGQHARAVRAYYSRLLRTHARRAAAVVTISRFSQRELAELLALGEDRLRVVSPALPTAFLSALAGVPDRSRLERYGLSPGYVLYSGGVAPRKNVHGLLRAYAIWRGRARDVPPLVMTGPAAAYRRFPAAMGGLAGSPGVHTPGYVRDEDMPHIVQQASMVVYPSFYEGFGLPVLEAMAAGLPVVCSDIGALREVAGDAAVFVDPRSPEDLAAALERVRSDSALRVALGAAGRRRSATFDVDRSAADLHRVLLEALDGS